MSFLTTIDNLYEAIKVNDVESVRQILSELPKRNERNDFVNLTVSKYVYCESKEIFELVKFLDHDNLNKQLGISILKGNVQLADLFFKNGVRLSSLGLGEDGIYGNC